MQVALSYGYPSGVAVDGRRAQVRMSGASERPTLQFRGVVKQPLALREALGALHDVVIADFRWRPPATRLEFERWLTLQLDKRAAAERAELDRSRRAYFEWLWATDRDLWRILDPVCSVHPDQVFFEAFSRDGSAYARVGLDRSEWDERGETVCGTTNVDFSTGLYESVRRLRSFWETELALGQAGVSVETKTPDAKAHTEKKVDLPEGWIRGFVQIGAAFLLESLTVTLLPVHMHDLLQFLKLNKAKVSPRALRWELTPGEPAEVVFEPWEKRFRFEGSSHTATEKRIVRIWGRRRLVLLERVLPLADTFEFRLLGRGLPYFITARAGGLDFTLGLSGWTRSDWTSTARFDTLIARQAGRGQRSDRPLAWLKQHFAGTAEEIAKGAGVEVPEVHASLVEAAGKGQVIFDLLRGKYRYRPLIHGELPAEALVGQDPSTLEGQALVARDAVNLTGTRKELDGSTAVRGVVTEDADHVYRVEVALNDQGGVARTDCKRQKDGELTGCPFFMKGNNVTGLCPHQYAVLLAYES